MKRHGVGQTHIHIRKHFILLAYHRKESDGVFSFREDTYRGLGVAGEIILYCLLCFKAYAFSQKGRERKRMLKRSGLRLVACAKIHGDTFKLRK